MNEKKYTTEINEVNIKLSPCEFRNNVNEYYIMFTVTNSCLTFEKQRDCLYNAYKEIVSSGFNGSLPLLRNAKPVFKRFFLSDAANQTDNLKNILNDECAISIIQQPPLCNSKIALFTIMMTGTDNKETENGLYKVTHNGYNEFWSTENISDIGNSYNQTVDVMSAYSEKLKGNGLTLADNCIRTWLYVNDIDNNYNGVVAARNDVFDKENLTDKTHYIASTGIQGCDTNHNVLCKMDAIAINGINKEQIHYLYALDYLNRTSEYGVRFERGAYIDFDERRRVYISGTASIDNKGNVLYIGDIRKQMKRMMENIQALLTEAECSFDDITEMTVYLRDNSDYNVVSAFFDEHFHNTPLIIVHAPVCRPTWLIETECIAVKRIAV